MQVLVHNGIALHWREDGDPAGVPVLFANSLGTDLRVWDAVLPHLPPGLRILRYDLRGHGLSETADRAFGIADLAKDAAALLDHLSLARAVFVGLSIGGLIGQALAVARPDLVRALCLSNSAARMGTPQMWRDRIGTITANGLDAVADDILDRWFAPAFRVTPEARAWRTMLCRTPAQGYLDCCAALAAADLTVDAARIGVPVLGLSGSDDAACPPDRTQATIDLISGGRMAVLDGAGHLPPVERPSAFAACLTQLIEESADD